MNAASGILTLGGACSAACGLNSNEDYHDFLVAETKCESDDDRLYGVRYYESTQFKKSNIFWRHNGRIKCMNLLFRDPNVNKLDEGADSSDNTKEATSDSNATSNPVLSDTHCIVTASPLHRSTREDQVRLFLLGGPYASEGSRRNSMKPLKRETKTIQKVCDIKGTQPFISIRSLCTDQYDADDAATSLSRGTLRLGVIQKNAFHIFAVPQNGQCDDFHCIASSEDKFAFLDYSPCRNDLVDKATGRQPREYFAGSFSPHHPSQTALGGSSLEIWDLRSREVACSERLHVLNTIRVLDFNPNLQYELATGGEDGGVRVWDLRKLRAPLRTFKDLHSHWIRAIQFNPYHDSLLLTGSSDNSVKLWQLPTDEDSNLAAHRERPSDDEGLTRQGSLELDELNGDKRVTQSWDSDEMYNGHTTIYGSSRIGSKIVDVADVLINEDKPEQGTRRSPKLLSEDGRCAGQSKKNISILQLNVPPRLLSSHECHENSVTGITWSAGDAWVYASWCGGGRFVVSQVPQEEKYRILL